jgi:hypothetical protein
MRTIAAIITLALFTSALQAQHLKESEVPAAVIKGFHDSYKDVNAKSWEKEKNGTYEVEFNLSKTEHAVIFNPEGQILWVQEEISATALPKTVNEYLDKNYPGYKIEEVKRGTMPTGDNNYEVEIKKGKDELELMFDSIGNFVSKEQD